MSFDISVEENEVAFEVSVSEGGDKITYVVRVDEEYMRMLGWEKGQTEKLLKKSFEFLLEREPKESILREFSLRDIARYFPEYEKHIGGALTLLNPKNPTISPHIF